MVSAKARSRGVKVPESWQHLRLHLAAAEVSILGRHSFHELLAVAWPLPPERSLFALGVNSRMNRR